jgi:hypothetical protein
MVLCEDMQDDGKAIKDHRLFHQAFCLPGGHALCDVRSPWQLSTKNIDVIQINTDTNIFVFTYNKFAYFHICFLHKVLNSLLEIFLLRDYFFLRKWLRERQMFSVFTVKTAIRTRCSHGRMCDLSYLQREWKWINVNLSVSIHCGFLIFNLRKFYGHFLSLAINLSKAYVSVRSCKNNNILT